VLRWQFAQKNILLGKNLFKMQLIELTSYLKSIFGSYAWCLTVCFILFILEPKFGRELTAVLVNAGSINTLRYMTL